MARPIFGNYHTIISATVLLALGLIWSKGDLINVIVKLGLFALGIWGIVIFIK